MTSSWTTGEPTTCGPPPGRPDGELGQESITLDAGQSRVFVTDWRYEKRRNDGSNFYGSHGRRLTNSGTSDLYVRLTGGRDGSTPASSC